MFFCMRGNYWARPRGPERDPAARHSHRSKLYATMMVVDGGRHEEVAPDRRFSLKRQLRVPSIPRQEATVSILEKEILLLGSKGSARRRALFDSGASYSIIRRDLAEALSPLDPIPDPGNYIFETARPGDTVQATHRVGLEFGFDDSEARFSDEFIVFEECSEEIIIGAKTMQAWSIKLDFDREEISYRKTAIRLRV